MSENAEQEQMVDALMRERRRKGMKRQKTLLCVDEWGKTFFSRRKNREKEEERVRERKREREKKFRMSRKTSFLKIPMSDELN